MNESESRAFSEFNKTLQDGIFFTKSELLLGQLGSIVEFGSDDVIHDPIGIQGLNEIRQVNSDITAAPPGCRPGAVCSLSAQSFLSCFLLTFSAGTPLYCISVYILLYQPNNPSSSVWMCHVQTDKHSTWVLRLMILYTWSSKCPMMPSGYTGSGREPDGGL